jgi:tRNA U34 5-methylaminomethyl-2-thiouridine-forming methyltransferase MnmC
MAETSHVYLNNSGVAERIMQGRSAAVLEVGLGTGMGLLITVDAAVQAGSELCYVALERDWLPADVLRQLELESWIFNRDLAESFLEFRERLPPRVDEGTYRWSAGDQQTVTIHVCDAITYRFDDSQKFDAVYFDPFAPQSNAQLWQADLFSRLSRVMQVDGRLVTYCVSRQVREAMTTAGLDVERVPGPVGGKREVLIASRRS